MTVLRDIFWEQAHDRLAETGWVIDGGHRYEPTVLHGLTPSGKVFDALIAPDGQLRMTVAGRSRMSTVTQRDIEEGDRSVTALLEAYGRLPPDER